MTEKTRTEHLQLDSGALLDLFLVIGILIGVKQSLLPYSQLYAGPASTLSAMIVGTFLLHLRGLSWSELGFRWPGSKLKTAILTAVTLVIVFAAIGGGGWIADQFFEDVGTSGRYDQENSPRLRLAAGMRRSPAPGATRL